MKTKPVRPVKPIKTAPEPVACLTIALDLKPLLNELREFERVINKFITEQKAKAKQARAASR